MRHLQVQVRADEVDRVIQLASEHGTPAPLVLQGHQEQEACRILLLSVPNDQVGAFMEAVEDNVEDAHAVLFPQGVLPLRTPLATVQEPVKRVAPRSTLELVVSALQSIGTWKGMLLYAAFSGLIAAYAVIFNVIYLLVAAMLIAPMGAPAMVSVIGVAIGSWTMLRRGTIRFWMAIAVLIGSAVALGVAYGLSVVPSTMADISSISSWVVLLSVVGGAAGAQSLVLSDRDSLVTGTATGFLIAVSLSPTSAVLGLALALGQWSYAGTMAFVLVLTFFGIVAGGGLLLRIVYGIRPQDPSTERGSSATVTVLAVVVTLAVVGLVGWQAQQEPQLQKADLSHRAIELTREASRTLPEMQLVNVSARFVPADESSSRRLLVSVVLEANGAAARKGQATAAVRKAVLERLRAQMTGVQPYVQVTVLPP